MKNLAMLTVAMGMALGMATHAQEDQSKALFQKKMCAACHGPGKKGGDLKDSKLDKTAIVKLLKDPKSVNPKAAMPAVKASDAEIETLANYVLTLRK